MKKNILFIVIMMTLTQSAFGIDNSSQVQSSWNRLERIRANNTALIQDMKALIESNEADATTIRWIGGTTLAMTVLPITGFLSAISAFPIALSTMSGGVPVVAFGALGATNWLVQDMHNDVSKPREYTLKKIKSKELDQRQISDLGLRKEYSARWSFQNLSQEQKQHYLDSLITSSENFLKVQSWMMEDLQNKINQALETVDPANHSYISRITDFGSDQALFNRTVNAGIQARIALLTTMNSLAKEFQAELKTTIDLM